MDYSLESRKKCILQQDVSTLLPEKNIVVFAPHFDDAFFMLGNYCFAMRAAGKLDEKNIHINILFARSNYLVGTGDENFDASLPRQKFATGQRLLEDMGCLDEVMGEFGYAYQLFGEKECFVRGKAYADSDMEFPQGTWQDFTPEDWQIFERMKDNVRRWAGQEDTALLFPLSFKDHIDHFIVREAAAAVAEELGGQRKAAFYFQEDKPYAGIVTEEEFERVNDFVVRHALYKKVYPAEPEKMIELAFRHYVTQVEEVYKTGIRQRAALLKDAYGTDYFCDQLFVLPREGERE